MVCAPDELGSAVLARAQALRRQNQAELTEAYQRMAADRERESEAEEWTEGLIGDAY